MFVISSDYWRLYHYCYCIQARTESNTGLQIEEVDCYQLKMVQQDLNRDHRKRRITKQRYKFAFSLEIVVQKVGPHTKIKNKFDDSLFFAFKFWKLKELNFYIGWNITNCCYTLLRYCYKYVLAQNKIEIRVHQVSQMKRWYPNKLKENQACRLVGFWLNW